MSGLEGLLNQATPGPWRCEVDSVLWAGDEMVGGFEKWADAHLSALAPETAAWAIKAAAWLSTLPPETHPGVAALLARFDQLNEKADQ